MFKLKKEALKLVSKAALLNAEKEVNSACVLWGYQPKMPETLKQKSVMKCKQHDGLHT